MVLMMLGIPINFEILKLSLRARNILIGAMHSCDKTWWFSNTWAKIFKILNWNQVAVGYGNKMISVIKAKSLIKID